MSDADPSGTPGDPNYDPHWDPAVSEPDVPVPGLGTWPDDYVPDHGTDAPPEHPDIEAAVSLDVAAANAQKWAVFQATVYADGVACDSIGAGDLDGFRRVLRFVLAGMLLRKPAPFVQVRCMDVRTQVWIDPSLDDTTARWPADWDGLLNVELKVTVGLGDKV